MPLSPAEQIEIEERRRPKRKRKRTLRRLLSRAITGRHGKHEKSGYGKCGFERGQLRDFEDPNPSKPHPPLNYKLQDGLDQAMKDPKKRKQVLRNGDRERDMYGQRLESSLLLMKWLCYMIDVMTGMAGIPCTHKSTGDLVFTPPGWMLMFLWVGLRAKRGERAVAELVRLRWIYIERVWVRDKKTGKCRARIARIYITYTFFKFVGMAEDQKNEKKLRQAILDAERKAREQAKRDKAMAAERTRKREIAKRALALARQALDGKTLNDPPKEPTGGGSPATS